MDPRTPQLNYSLRRKFTPSRPKAAISSLRRLAGMFEEEIQGLVGLNMGSNPPHGTILFVLHLDCRHGFALLPGDLLHFAVHFLAGGMNGFALRNFRKQYGGL